MEALKEKVTLKNDFVKLKKDFEKELQDETFKDFILKLNISYDELVCNRHFLLESFTEYTNCQNCKNIASCQNKVTGYAYLPKVQNEKLVFSYKECKFKHKLEQKNKYLENVYLSYVPKKIREASMKDIYKDDKNRFKAIKYLIHFMEQYKQGKSVKGLYLHGNFGVGKTYLIAAMFNELAKDNIKSAIVFLPEFLRELKSSFGNDFEEKFTKIKNVPLLLIDDIGAETVTPWGRDEILCSILQHRMNENLPTFFTSNLSLEELERHLSLTKDKVDEVKAKRLMERIIQLTNAEQMFSENLRK